MIMRNQGTNFITISTAWNSTAYIDIYSYLRIFVYSEISNFGKSARLHLSWCLLFGSWWATCGCSTPALARTTELRSSISSASPSYPGTRSPTLSLSYYSSSSAAASRCSAPSSGTTWTRPPSAAEQLKSSFLHFQAGDSRTSSSRGIHTRTMKFQYVSYPFLRILSCSPKIYMKIFNPIWFLI